jgi:hypothetical protein
MPFANVDQLRQPELSTSSHPDVHILAPRVYQEMIDENAQSLGRLTLVQFGFDQLLHRYI